MTLGQRIRHHRKRIGKNQTEIAEMIGVSQDAISNWENNRREPSLEDIEKLARVFGISVHDLIPDAGQNEEKAVHEAPGTKYITLPILTVCPSAGPGAVAEEELPMETSISFSEEYLRLMKVRPQNLRALTVAGESMQPLLFAGDVIVVDVSQCELNEDGIYVIRHDGRVKVKKLHGLGRGRIKIISTHPDYEPVVVGPEDPPDELKICGRVVWSGRRM